MKKIIFYCFLFIISKYSFCQNDTSKRVTAIYRSYENKIVLRLFPSNLNSLADGNKYGYIIERAEGEKNNQFKLIQAGIIKRMPEDSSAYLFIEKNKKDTFDLKMTGMAYGISDEKAKPLQGDVTKDAMISLRQRQQEESMKFFMFNIACNRSSLAAKVVGLWAEDTDVKNGLIYTYRVKINDNKSDWYYLKVNCKKFNPNYLVNNKQFKMQEGDTKLSFSFAEGNDFYAVDYAKSNFDTLHFQHQSKEPILKLNPLNSAEKLDYAYRDSNLLNYKRYYYKIWGFTPFGDKLLLGEISGMPRDKTPPPTPGIVSALHEKPELIKIKWNIDETKLGDLKGFVVARGNKNEGPFKQISRDFLPPGTRSFEDAAFDKAGENYYVVEAIDTAKNSVISFPAYVTLIDSIPPARPTLEKAIIDSAGKIIIKIKPNTERDFAGYQLLKANAKEHEFSVVQETYRDSTGAKTFILYDSTTLKSLTPKVYYQLVAFDRHYNQSEASEIIELKRPDTIPPVPPIIKDYKITDTSVILTFVNSTSDDAVANYLLRREVGKQNFDTVYLNKDTKVTKFIDFKITGGREYEYTMIAKDDSKRSSKKSRSIILKTIENNKVPAPAITATYNANTKAITISYTYKGTIKTRKATIEIYKRKSKEADWAVCKTAEIEGKKQVVDDKLDKTVSVFYIAKIIDDNKNTSTFSNSVEIKIN